MAPVRKRSFKLVIEDDRQAAWMAINNSFTKSRLIDNWDVPMDHGLLIQIGKSKRWPDEFLMDEVGSVEFIKAGKRLRQIDKVELEDPLLTWWVNITQGRHPMKPEHLEELRASPPQSLHKYFIPYPGGITLWPSGPLDIRVQKAKGKDPQHLSYAFKLKKPVTVEVFLNGERDENRSSAHYDEIRISLEKGLRKPPPGQTWNPPQYP